MLTVNSVRKQPLRRHRMRWNNNMMMDLKEIGFEDVRWIESD
jgi:hypothetical protein